MSARKWIALLFAAAALYDGLLGLAFLAAPQTVFDSCGVTPPNHMGYVHFPAALLLIFALMFVQIARDPIGNRRLIPYGILLKVAYCGVAGWHWLDAGIPEMWRAFVFIDLATAVLFAWAYVTVPGSPSAAPARPARP